MKRLLIPLRNAKYLLKFSSKPINNKFITRCHNYNLETLYKKRIPSFLREDETYDPWECTFVLNLEKTNKILSEEFKTDFTKQQEVLIRMFVLYIN
jgi:hypothetical protein